MREESEQYFMNSLPKNQKKTLTILEIFLVFFILAVVAGVVFSAFNPIDRLADGRDAQRIVDMHALITAIHQYVVDTNGTFPDGMSIEMQETQLGSCESGGTTLCGQAQAHCADISDSISSYLEFIPIDPLLSAQATLSGYSVRTSPEGIVTVRACGAETSDLEVSR